MVERNKPAAVKKLVAAGIDHAFRPAVRAVQPS
jgi:hypothetical protein